MWGRSDHLILAGRLAAQLGQELEREQTAIAGQGYRIANEA